MTARGIQDASGWGLLGLTVGALAGFALSLQLAVRLFSRPVGTWGLTAMTTLVVAAMTVGGGIGYWLTRRATPRPAP